MLVFENHTAQSRLKDRDGLPLTWRITLRKDGSHSVEQSDFALQNYLDSGTLIATWKDAMNACCQAERKIALAKDVAQIMHKEIVSDPILYGDGSNDTSYTFEIKSKNGRSIRLRQYGKSIDEAQKKFLKECPQYDANQIVGRWESTRGECGRS